jgi:caffeoyl-CoA O-methyltransferase
MSQSLPSDEQLRDDAQTRAFIDRELQVRFAPEDDVLRGSIARAQAENLPPVQIAPLQGKLLQILAMACGARTILEIGTLAGYSGVWLARSLPPNGRLISLEVNPKYAEIARTTFAAAGLSDCAEVRVGPALDLLPTLVPEAPFDLIFIDADKPNYLRYLDWAITLSRVGSLIVADNVIWGGGAFQTLSPDESSAGAVASNRKLLEHPRLAGLNIPNREELAAGAAAYIGKILEHPRLISVAFPSNDDGMDGFAISVVRD